MGFLCSMCGTCPELQDKVFNACQGATSLFGEERQVEKVACLLQGVAIAVLASVMPSEPKYDASVHEKLMPISGDMLSQSPAVNY